MKDDINLRVAEEKHMSERIVREAFGEWLDTVKNSGDISFPSFLGGYQAAMDREEKLVEVLKLYLDLGWGSDKDIVSELHNAAKEALKGDKE